MTDRRPASRREFLRLATMGGVAVAIVAACAPAAPPTATPAPKATEAPKPTAAASPTPVAQAVATKGEVTITLNSWWNKPFTALLPKFNAKHPNIKMNLVDAAFAAHHEKLLATLVAGSGAPDIAGIEDARIPIFADTGGLFDLSKHLEPYRKKIVPYKLNLGTYRGKNYSVPWDGSPVVLYYRRDVFEQNKIDPAAIQTYNDLLTVGKTLKDATGGKVKLWNVTKDSWFPLVNFTWQQGSGLFDLDDTKVTIDGPQGVRALEYLKALWDAGVVHQGLGGDAANTTYKDGTTAAVPGAIWSANSIKGVAPESSGKWGIVRLPAWDKGGSTAMTYGGSQLAIPAQGKHVDEAFAFLEYTQLTQAGQEVLWLEGDLFPVLIDAVNWPILNNPVDFYGGQKALKLYAEVNADVLPYAFGKGWLEGIRILGLAQADVFDGKKSPKDALAAAAKEMRDKLKLG